MAEFESHLLRISRSKV